MLTQAHVGRFEIREFLGRGAIGDVYLAWDPKLDAEIALKLVRTAKTDPDMVAAERNGTALQDAIARIAPQVAAVYEQGDQDGFFWVAMEYVAGHDLARILEREAPFDERRAVSIALQLCEMLEMFHELTTEGRRGIVHGDLKPENIRIQDGDRVRVLDFGIAKHLSQTRRFTHNLFGSLPYTPPERLNSGRLDTRSDLWAVGVILYLMVSGYPPWSGQDPEDLEGRIRRGEPPVPLPEGVSAGLKKILYRTLAFDPERRYPTATALRSDLEAWRDGTPLSEPGEEPAKDDLNATRRTSRPLGGETRRTDRPEASDLDATRRTSEIPPPPPPPPAPSFAEHLAAIPGQQPEAPSKPRPRKRWWLALAGAFVLAFGLSQFWIQGEAKELQRALATDTDPELLPILEDYRKVSWLGMFNPAMGKVRDELREALVASADRIIEGYHGDYPSTRERGWQKAYDHLRGAVELNYLDRKVRAKMYYCKAHLDRIASQGLKERAERAQKVDAALAGFREAARRDKDWPDPYLGLARIYAYERPDLDQLQKSLVELEKRGYRLGKRERTMEGDGYRMRAEELWARAQRARGTRGADTETELLERTRDNLLQAINFYDDATGYADVKTNRARAHDRLDQVQTRLRVLETPGFLDELFGIIVEEGRRGPDG